MTKRILITLDRLKEVLHYNPKTGLWTWLKVLSKRIHIGDIAGATSDGYIVIRVDGILYGAHRLAWFYMTGEWPPHTVDHEDTNRSNNQWGNLRLATLAEQNRNVGIQKNNKSGFKGVSLQPKMNKWRARITVDSKTVHLGLFETAEQASRAYQDAADKYYEDFAWKAH